MEAVVEKILSIAYIAIFLIAIFGLMVVVSRVSNYLIRKILGIGGN
ncbi:MAG: hypothetical protein N3A59_06105 [Thermodesulfovibrionales bacterium]|nr:hypothetical protein [Thermodesulfovibrionales bacterium]